MGHEELIAALRRKGEEKTAALHRQHDEEIRRLRQGLEDRKLEARQRCRQTIDALALEIREEVVGEARRQARQVVTEARSAIVGRLYEIAEEMLVSLRNGDYERLFAELVAELPDEGWQEVRVHPADHDLVQRYVPAGRPVLEPSIAGGLIAVGRDGMFLCDNSLNKRLARAWPRLRAKLLAELESGRKLDEPAVHTEA